MFYEYISYRQHYGARDPEFRLAPQNVESNTVAIHNPKLHPDFLPVRLLSPRESQTLLPSFMMTVTASGW